MNTDIPQPPPFIPVPPPSTEPVLPEKLDTRALFEALLRSPRTLVQRLADPGHGALGRFLAIAVGSMLVFGLVLGSFAMKEQLWAAPLKITAGLLIAGLICFPSLYIFSCRAGSRAGAGCETGGGITRGCLPGMRMDCPTWSWRGTSMPLYRARP